MTVPTWEMLEGDDVDELRDEWGDVNDELKPLARFRVEERDEWAREVWDADQYYLELETTGTYVYPRVMRVLAEHDLRISEPTEAEDIRHYRWTLRQANRGDDE